MPQTTKRKHLVVYVTESELATLKEAAAAEQRSLSSFLLHLGLERAKRTRDGGRGRKGESD
jgi:uncharacterized protein (DUF1778 family)